MSDFLRSYPLFTGIETALVAHPMRALHGAALRTLLDVDRGRLLVRVAGALLPLGGASLRYGHGSLVRLPGAAAGTLVQIGTAVRAPPLAVGAAEDERGGFQQP